MKRHNSHRQSNRPAVEQLSSRYKPEYQSLVVGGVSIQQKDFSKEYLKLIKELNEAYADDSKLPSKVNLSEEENRKYDVHRINFINKALNFLCDYYVSGKSPFNKNLNIAELEFAYGLKLLNSRHILEYIAFTIYNLSGNLRSKYKSLLQPQPFTWETFEQLGGGMKVAPSVWLNMLVKGISGEAADRLFEEYREAELFTEAAIPTILQVDLPKLKSLFSYIASCESDAQLKPDKIRPVELLAIKAYTKRIVDTENLIHLLKLSDNKCTNINHREITSVIDEVGEKNRSYMLEVENDDKTFERQFNLDTKLGRHAALRRLEKIGELITGKNFSSSLTKLDSTIDWQAFVVIRDTIAHQDQGDNKSKIERLLTNNGLFLSILREEMQEFFTRLNQIITLRDQRLPKFKKDKETEFWQEVYLYDKKALEPAQEEKLIQARTSKENVKLIIDTLKDLNAPLELQIKWVKILNGHSEIPSTKEKGDLFKVLSLLRGQKPELFKECKDIIDKAINIPSIKKNKEQIMKEQQEAKERRKIEEEQNLTGLVNLRALAQNFKDAAGPKLSRIQKVEAAIEALENIKEFMEQDIFVRADFNFPNVKEWDQEQQKQNSSTVMHLFARLVTNPEFNDAIEYNAAQLLQHLDSISKFREAKGKRFLDRDYEFVRNFRNYVVHGNHLMEKESYDPSKKNESILMQRQKVIAPTMITFILELLPILREVKEQIEINRKQYKDDINQALATVIPFSQALRNPGKNQYFSNSPLEVIAHILSFTPEVKVLSPQCIVNLLQEFQVSKIVQKDKISEIINTKEQYSYVEKLQSERDSLANYKGQ